MPHYCTKPKFILIKFSFFFLLFFAQKFYFIAHFFVYFNNKNALKPTLYINNSTKIEKTKQLNVLKLHKNSISIVKNENNIKPEKDKIEVIPIENSTRIVNLIPAEKVVVELLPGS